MTIDRRVDFALRHLRLAEQKVLDLGCGPGRALRHFGAGSLGLDLTPEPARREGLECREWNFADGIPRDLWGGFDAVWCSALLEHVLSPHHFLIQSGRALRPGGTMVVVVPRTNRLSRGPWRGFLATDHVNFFRPDTLRLTLERAGIDVTYLGTPSLPELGRLGGRALRGVGINLIAAGRPVPDFQYPAKAEKRLEGDEIVLG